VGLRISETVHLDIRDWRPDLGDYGKLHVRFGKGSRGRGPKTRLVPAIDSADALLGWWLADVRHQFGDDWADPDAPLLPSERRDRMTGHCLRAGDDALRSGLAGMVGAYLPAWRGRLTPHVLRHFCASSLYSRGMDLKAIQELLGHSWLSTTTSYIHEPSGIASAGRETAGHQFAAVSEWCSRPSDGNRLTRQACGAIPSDAGFTRQKVEVVGGFSSSAPRRGRGLRGWTPMPGRGIRTVGIPESAIRGRRPGDHPSRPGVSR
jgi:hypothetical protein